jgi:predicted DNA binding CopG/RHH family protein
MRADSGGAFIAPVCGEIARGGRGWLRLASAGCEERRFWETHDSTNYVDWSEAKPVRLPRLKPSSTSISLRLPVAMLERIKIAANRRDVPYQSLIKIWLAEKLAKG